MSFGAERIAAMVGRLFAGRLAADAIYTPAGGAGVPVRGILLTRDLDNLGDFDLEAQQTARFIDVTVAAIPVRPSRGDTIEILAGGWALPGVYAVAEDAMSTDRFQLVWRCRVGEPS